MSDFADDCHGKGKYPYAPHHHEKYYIYFSGIMKERAIAEYSAIARGESDGSKGGGCLKEYAQEGQSLHFAEQYGRDDHIDGSYENDGVCFVDLIWRNSAAEDMHMRLSAEGKPHPQKRQCDRRDFQAASRPSGTAAYHHKKCTKKEVGVCKSREIDGVESRRSIVHGRKPGSQNFLIKRELFEGIIPLEREEQSHPDGYQKGIHSEYYFGMYGDAGKLFFAKVIKFNNDDIADAAQNDKQRNCKIDDKIALVSHQIVTKERESCIIEG